MAEYLAQNKSSNEPTLKSSVSIDNTPTETQLSEKEELLKELETPEKSFKTPIIEKVVSKQPEQQKVEAKPLGPDHQLQNTHIEEPFTTTEFLHPTEKAVEPEKPVPTTPTIQKPAKIEIRHDIYREPIE